MPWQWVLILIARRYFPNIGKPSMAQLAGATLVKATGEVVVDQNVKEDLIAEMGNNGNGNSSRRRDMRLLRSGSNIGFSNESKTKLGGSGSNLEGGTVSGTVGGGGPDSLNNINSRL